MFENSNDNGFCRIIWSDAIFIEADARSRCQFPLPDRSGNRSGGINIFD